MSSIKTMMSLGSLVLILTVNAVDRALNSGQCANEGEICSSIGKNACCDENLTCKWSDFEVKWECKGKAKIGDFCRFTIDCSDITHSTCSPTKRCVCRENNIQVSDHACAPLLNEFCWTNEICLPINSVCVENNCQCKNGFLAQSNDQCVPRLLGSTCNDDAACGAIKFSKCSSIKTCVCSENTIPTSEVLCSVPLQGYCITDSDCGVTYSWCIDNKCQCKSEYVAHSNIECGLPYIGMPCEDSDYCKNRISNSFCIDNQCQCSATHSPWPAVLCLPLSMYCSTDEECSIANSVCIAHQCQCRPNYVMHKSKCLPKYLGGSCETTVDCSELKFTICSRGKCVCNFGFFPINQTTCGRALGEDCSNTEDCSVRFSHCYNNKCKCNSGYIQFFENQCIATQLGIFCVNDNNCNLISNARCFDSQCTCKNNHVQKSATECTPLLNQSCSIEKPCVPENSVCIDHKCQCKPNYLQHANIECVPKYLDKFCIVDTDCIDIPYANCSAAGNCICHSNYMQIGPTTCAPLLGSYCNEDNDCIAEHAICLRNQCLCSVGYYQHSDLLCSPVFLGESCENDQDCDNISNGQCSDEKECICKPNYLKFNEVTCLSLIGGTCNENKDCSVYNSNCIDNKCQCLENYVPMSQSNCISTALYTNCNSNDDCHDIINSRCSRFNFCVCKSNYISVDGKFCMPALGIRCSQFSDCITPNSHCIDDKCQCRENFANGPYNDCLPTQLGAICETNDDCININYSKCLNNKCICKNKYIPLNNTTCAPLLYGICSKDRDCYGDNTHCIDNKCQYNPNSSVTVIDTVKPISLGNPCETNVNCSTVHAAICSEDKMCVCRPNTFAVNKTACTSFLNTTCLSSFDCGVKSSSCIENKCQCNFGFAAISDIKCVRNLSLYYCDNTLECGEPWHSQCLNNKCICKSNNVAVNTLSCMPILGGSCWRKDQCLTKYSDCIDFHCQCISGFISVANNMCVSH